MYVIEVFEMYNRDAWKSHGFHQSGSGLPGDMLTIGGRERALEMGMEFARARVALYRRKGHRARIVGPEGRVILDWDDQLESSQDINIHNSHESLVWRDKFEGRTLELPLVHNRATKKYYLKLPEFSVAADSPAAVFERFVSNQHWRPLHDQFVVDDILPSPEPTDAVPAGTPWITVPADTVFIGVRPGSARSKE